jgi:hypothetical protein
MGLVFGNLGQIKPVHLLVPMILEELQRWMKTGAVVVEFSAKSRLIELSGVRVEKKKY